jgi:hypothetical protein
MRSTTIIQDNPVKFSSTRKHPFDVFSDSYAPPERENPYLFGRDSINFLGVPLLADRSATGGKQYICAKQV